MGNGNGRTVLHQLFEGILYHAFAFGIEGRSGFVQDEDRRVLQDGTGNADTLALTTGKLASTVANHGIVTFFAGHDEVVCIGYLGGFHHLVHSGIFYPEGDVVEEGIVEQDGFLVHVTHDTAKVVQGRSFYIYSVNQHFTFLYIVITRNQVHHGRFTRTGLSHQGDGLSLFDGEVDVLQYPLGIVLEGYVLEFNLFLQWADVYRIGYLRHLVFCHQNLVYTFHAGQAFRDGIAGSGKFLQRIDEAIKHHQIEDEGRSRDGAVVVQNQCTAKPQYDYNQHGTQEFTHRVSHLLAGVHSIDGISIRVVGMGKALVHLMLGIERLDDAKSTQGFFYLSHEVTPLVLCNQ